MTTNRARALRRNVLFVVGLCLIIFEAVRPGPVRPALLPLYALMVGLKFVLPKEGGGIE